MASLEVRELGKQYGDAVALKRCSLSIASGELAVVLGHSGSGKTTLLRLIAGLESPTCGDVFIGGAAVNTVPPRKRDLAMTFQRDALLPHLSVAENVAFPLRMQRLKSVEIRDRVRQALESVGLELLQDRLPDQLSGGQRQLAAIARSIVKRPSIWLMDEPFSHLDTPLRGQLRTELWRLQRKLRTTTIFVTHDQQEAMVLADRLVILDHGAIIYCGDPLRAYDQPPSLAVAKFLGSPGMNLLPWPELDERWKQCCRPPANVNGAHHVLGIRPEHIQLGDVDGQDCVSEGVVQSVLCTGADTHVEMLVDGALLWAKTPERLGDHVGKRIAVGWQSLRTTWFDARTGNRLPVD